MRKVTVEWTITSFVVTERFSTPKIARSTSSSTHTKMATAAHSTSISLRGGRQ
jgi:hypothetical protein